MKKFISLFTVVFLSLTMNVNAQIDVISGGTGLAASYTSLTNAGGLFEALNTNDQTGQAIVISITGNSIAETGTHSLTGAAGMWSSINMTPSGSWTISGTPAAGIPLIDMNGADLVTIDGINFGGNTLTISNLSTSSTAGTSTLRFRNGASNNFITDCSILGSSQTALNTEGGTIVIGTDIVTPDGNDFNYIHFCDIGPASATLPVKAIFGLGTATSSSSLNYGTNLFSNNIYDFFGSGAGSTAGINILEGNDHWQVVSNRLYQTAPRVFTTTALRYSGIVVNTSQANFPGSFEIWSNTIGFASATQTGVTAISGSSNEFRGLNIQSVSTTDLTTINYNTISGITQTSSRASTATGSSAFIGISLGTTDGLIDASQNVIGSSDGASSIVLTLTSSTTNTSPVLGIYNFSFFNTVINGNEIGFITITGTGGVTGFRGILVNTNIALTADIQYNNIHDITNTKSGGNANYGIQVALPNVNVLGNNVYNFIGNGNGATITMAGILCTGSTGNNIIEKNIVYNLRNTVTGGSSGAVYGIDVTFPATTNEVKQNYVYGLSVTSTLTSYQIYGFIRRAGGNANVYNNMISLGLNTNGTSITTGFSIIGIRDIASASGSFNYYYNTVYIGGSGITSPTSNSYAMYSDVITNSRNFLNNIFINERSNAVAGGNVHLAVRYGGTGVNPAGLTSNYNDLYVSGTDGVVGFYDAALRLTLADWQTATGQDANSTSVAVSFINLANGNLDLDGSSVGDESLIGTPIAGILTDIHKNIRDTQYPYMGANEASTPLPVELTSFTSSVNGNNVTLNWSTASETNNSGFDIQKTSVNGSWSKIGNVNGSGTTTNGNSYSFTDNNSASGKYNYRLKQIDFNGNFEYFNLSNEVNIGVPSDFSLSQNYPNPFNPSTKINYDLPVDGNVSIKLFDMSGREVATLVNEVKTAGYYSLNFNASNLSSGIYFYTISAGNFVATKKMTLIK